MSDVLKGNFKTCNEVAIEPEKPASLEERFEMEALRRLGGSIAFVSRKTVVWDTGSEPPAPKDEDAD